MNAREQRSRAVEHSGVYRLHKDCNTVHDGKLHTNSGPPGAEDDRSAVSTGQLWSSVFHCCRPSTWNSLPDSLHDPAPSLSIFRRHQKTTFWAKD